MSMTERNLETYLKQATRGIWGKRKQDAILELRGNIEARIWTLEHQGKTQTEALEIALNELGDARAVNAGMTQVHTMPNVTRNILLAGLISSFAITTLATRAQVTVIADDGTTDFSTPLTKSVFVSMSSLKANLEAAGIAVDDTPQAPADYFGKPEKNQPNPTPTLEFTFPGAKYPTKIQAIIGLTITSDQRFASLRSDAPTMLSRNAKEGEIYINFPSIAYQLRNSGLPVSIKGWRNPELQVGKTKFQIGDEESPMYAYNTYLGIAARAMREQFGLDPNNTFSYTSPKWCSREDRKPCHKMHAIRVKDTAGSIYAIASADNQDGLTYEVARVSDTGILEFESPWNILVFGASKTGIEQDMKQIKTQRAKFGAAKRDSFGAYLKLGQPAHAVLLKLSGNFDPKTAAKIVIPAKTRSVALPTK